MAGYAGKFLRVNLTTGGVTAEPVPEQVKKDFIGGRGFGVRYLYDEVAPGVDPLSPENKLLLLVGPLAGTTAQFCSRWVAVAKSPLTGILGAASGGGDFGAWMKFAGFDFIIIEGKAAKPVYLYIERDHCEIRDGTELWGMTTAQTQDRLRDVHGKQVRAACIGPGGEKLVRYAAIVSGRRTASRCGMGTVMGAKNLKAVAINASRNIELHNPGAFRQLVKKQIDICKADTLTNMHSRYGTTGGVADRSATGSLPVRNYRAGQLDGAEKLSRFEYEKLRIGEFGCYSCLCNCGKTHKVVEGPYAGAYSEGPEYESEWAFTGPIDSDDIGVTIAADSLCDQLGIDTLSAGATIGFAYELFGRGIITAEDTDGLELTYGNHAAMMALIEKIGRREGFGDLLAEGAKRVAEHIGRGSEAYAMQVKGLEIPAYEPRSLKLYGLNFATANIGGSVTYGSAAMQNVKPIPRPVDRFADEGIGDICAFNQKLRALVNSVIVCLFGSLFEWYTAGMENQPLVASPLLAQLLAAATGIAEFESPAYLDKAAERILNLDRAFNVREGLDRKDDTLPERFLTEPLQKAGPAEGQLIRKLDTLLDEYYGSLNWTKQGIPTPEKLEELGLGAVIEHIGRFMK